MAKNFVIRFASVLFLVILFSALAIHFLFSAGITVVLWIFAGIYILSIACTFLIRASIDLGLVGIVLLEFVVPYGMAELIVYLKKRGQNYELHGN